MKTINKLCAASVFAFFLLATSALYGEDVKTYQVTGPVLEVTSTKIVIQKGEDKWELLRNKNTKITGELKVGAKATIYYTMAAQEVEVKADKKK
jgi:hypothetical protein